jgi:hypothetical protein
MVNTILTDLNNNRISLVHCSLSILLIIFYFVTCSLYVLNYDFVLVFRKIASILMTGFKRVLAAFLNGIVCGSSYWSVMDIYIYIYTYLN